MSLPDDDPAATPAAPPAHQIHIAHEDHDHDPSNPHIFGLPLGVILAGLVAVVAVGLTALKFIHPYQALGLH